MSDNYIKMEVREIQLSEDPRELPVIVLHEKDGDRHFPIFIGHYEGNTLDDAVRVNAIPLSKSKRPLTHDLLLSVLDALSAELSRVLITRLENGTFYGAMELKGPEDKTIVVDSRPSDAMILAIKRQISIFVEEKVLAEAHQDTPD